MKPIKSTTLVASAASLAASASSLHGVILLTEANFTATIGVGSSTIFFDLTQSGSEPHFSGDSADVPNHNFSLGFELFYGSWSLGVPEIRLGSSANGAPGVASSPGYAARLSANTTIDQNLSFPTYSRIFLARFASGPWGSYYGDTISGFLGLAIQNGTDVNFGWAEVEWYHGSDTTTDPSTITLKRFAYQTEVNTPIEAGAIPEPATAGLFAALAAGAGALALRRRRAA
jgi:hypothetical protein